MEKLIVFLFALLQLLDGLLTYYGVVYTSPGFYEAGIVPAIFMGAVRIESALIVLKTISVVLGLVLFFIGDGAKFCNLTARTYLLLATGLMGVVMILHGLTWFYI